MLSDVALFEPNQRGRRAYDVFLSDKARQLDPGDFKLALRMGKAFFSLFRCTARHEVAGVWLEDLLVESQKIWLMDQSMESFAPAEGTFGMRLFDAGEFHVGFGIVAPSDDETTEFAIQGIRLNGRVPFRHSLAVTLYGDSLRDTTPLSPELDFAITSLLARTIEGSANSRREIGARGRPHKTKPPHRDLARLRRAEGRRVVLPSTCD